MGFEDVGSEVRVTRDGRDSVGRGKEMLCENSLHPTPHRDGEITHNKGKRGGFYVTCKREPGLEVEVIPLTWETHLSPLKGRR